METLQTDEHDIDALAERDRLVTDLVTQLRRRGHYVAEVSMQPPQRLIDLRWAAQLAGRILGRRTCTYARAVGNQTPGMVTVVIAPTEAHSPEEIALREGARTVIESLISGAQSR